MLHKLNVTIFCLAIFIHFNIVANAQGGTAYGQLRSMTDYNPNIPEVPKPSCADCVTSAPSATTYHMTQADYNVAYGSFINETGNNINEKGVEFFNKKDYAKALRYFIKAAKYLPDNAVIQKNIANAKQQIEYQKSEKERIAYAAALKKYNEQKQKELERYNRDIAEKEISAAIDEIAKTKKQIAFIQLQLRNYSKELNNNRSEFEKWGATVDEAYQNTISNSKEYIAQMFIKYGLLKALDPENKKAAYNFFSKYLHSSNPKVQQWIIKECNANNVNIKVMEGIVNGVNADKDIADFLTSNKPQLQQNLNALLFINGFFESAELVDYDGLLGKKFPGVPGDYFEQAKMIGETYSDLAAQCLSWYSINRLSDRNNEIAEKVQILSANMKFQEQKMECLHTCLESSVKGKTSKYCVSSCTGKSRFSSPVPAL
ncbi:MAG: hypothetical protein KGL19_02585 [Bacteroidota bacterium]|nr:hypothetical protein [Bacteroidota bacterium]